jgi:hypothetical protein
MTSGDRTLVGKVSNAKISALLAELIKETIVNKFAAN